jgi:hypothetical protein
LFALALQTPEPPPRLAKLGACHGRSHCLIRKPRHALPLPRLRHHSSDATTPSPSSLALGEHAAPEDEALPRRCLRRQLQCGQAAGGTYTQLYWHRGGAAAGRNPRVPAVAAAACRSGWRRCLQRGQPAPADQGHIKHARIVRQAQKVLTITSSPSHPHPFTITSSHHHHHTHTLSPSHHHHHTHTNRRDKGTHSQVVCALGLRTPRHAGTPTGLPQPLRASCHPREWRWTAHSALSRTTPPGRTRTAAGAGSHRRRVNPRPRLAGRARPSCPFTQLSRDNDVVTHCMILNICPPHLCASHAHMHIYDSCMYTPRCTSW